MDYNNSNLPHTGSEHLLTYIGLGVGAVVIGIIILYALAMCKMAATK
jgi:LPXTG-motif cell wall-anchored protein